MKKPAKTMFTARHLTAAIILIALIVTATTGFTYSRYTAVVTGTGTATASVMAYGCTAELKAESGPITAPGDSSVYIITVKNNSGETQSEVEMQYYLEAETTGSIPLTFTISDGDAHTEENKTCFTGSGFVFGTSTAQTHTYELTVLWDSGETSWEYANEIELITITAIFEQVI